MTGANHILLDEPLPLHVFVVLLNLPVAMHRLLLVFVCTAVLMVLPAQAQEVHPLPRKALAVTVSLDPLPQSGAKPVPGAKNGDVRLPLHPYLAGVRPPTVRLQDDFPRSTSLSGNRYAIRPAPFAMQESSSSRRGGRTLLIVGLSTLAAAGVAAAVIFFGEDGGSDTPPIADPPGRP